MIALSDRVELKTASLRKTTRNILDLIGFLQALAAITGQAERVNAEEKIVQHRAVKIIREVWIRSENGRRGS